MSNSDAPTILGLNFEIGTYGKRYVRSVHTFERGLAIIGGILSALIAIFGMYFNFFNKDL